MSDPESRVSPSASILTINGGSSSIKFSVCSQPAVGAEPVKWLAGSIDRIGLDGSSLQAMEPNGKSDQVPIQASDHRKAAHALADWLKGRIGQGTLVGIGHRVVHGGFRLVEHQVVTDGLIAELKKTQPLDLAHLPREIALIEVFRDELRGVPQVACFDTEFHRDLPRVAHLLPIPRSYDRQGVRRFGFHGLSYTYLVSELARVSPEAAIGKVVLAHLGSGASMAAVCKGKPVDTTMAFTPTAGLVMGTRPGDLDPGLLVYLSRVESMSPAEMDEFVSRRCGLLGVSETTSDMQDLLARRGADVRAAEAVDLFCYQAKKTLGAYAAAMGGLETLVFSGGIGEHSPEVRSQICSGLDHLGIRLDQARNESNAPVISVEGGTVAVRVIATDEEAVIARIVSDLLGRSAKVKAQ